MEERGTEERLSRLLVDQAQAIRSLAALLPAAYERQWSPGYVRARPSTLNYSDPTGEVAADAQRLRLRMAVFEAERAVEDATRVVRETEARLADVLGDWAGLREDLDAC